MEHKHLSLIDKNFMSAEATALKKKKIKRKTMDQLSHSKDAQVDFLK